MKFLIACFISCVCMADQVIVRDFEGRPVRDAAVRVLLVRRNHPFSDGSLLVSGATDENGAWDFQPGAFHVSRVHVDKAGHHEARLEGLRVPVSPMREVILPRKGEAVPLHARRARAQVPGHAFSGVVAYDFEKGDQVAPGHRGSIPDVFVRIEAKQVGWTGWKTSDQVADFLAKEKDPSARAGFIAVNGKWEITLELSFPNEGDGVLESVYAEYAVLRLPSAAPVSGYAARMTFDNRGYGRKDRGFFVRVRTVKDAFGNIVSANYAKIYGTPVFSPGGFAFQYYFNPVANDRRLELDLSRNLQKPGPDVDWLERLHCEVRDP